MKNYRFTADGGGVFSRFLHCAVIPLADIDFDKVYLDTKPWALDSPSGQWWEHSQRIIAGMEEAEMFDLEPYDLPFNYVLNQTLDGSYINGGVLPVGTMYNSVNTIENSPRFQDYKSVLSRLSFKKNLLGQVANRHPINWDKTLGVHARLTIRNFAHDHVVFDSYVHEINHALANYNYEHIFVSSDNIETIHKLTDIYGNLIVYNENFHRPINEMDDCLPWEQRNWFKKFYWWEAFADCMTLARSQTLICRISNFSNAAILFGNFNEIIRL